VNEEDKRDTYIKESQEEKEIKNYTLLSSLPEQNTNKNEISQKEKILLNSPGKNTESSLATKQEKMRLGIIYGFTFFCLVVIILLALKKL